MLLVAQRVLGKTIGINVFVYVHPSKAAPVLARDPSLAFDHTVMKGLGFAPSLALTVRAVTEPRATVTSFLDIAFPDAMPAATVAGLIEQGVLRGPAGNHDVTWVNNGIALRFRTDPKFVAALELKDLKAAILAVLGHSVTRLRNEKAIATRPSQPVKIYRDRAAHGWRFTLDASDRMTLMTLVGALPTSFSIADERLLEFEHFALAPIQHVAVEALTNVSVDQISAYGGAVIIDRPGGSIFWQAK